MKKYFYGIFVLLVFGLFLISGCQKEAVGKIIIPDNGGGEPVNPDEIIANSCDADSVCEVDTRVSSLNSLTLSSEIGAVKVEGDLTLTKIGYANGVLFVTNDTGSLTIIPDSGASKIVGTLTVTDNVGMKYLNVDGWSDLEGDVTVGQELIIDSLTGSGNAYVCVNNLGKLYRSQTPCV